MTFPTAPTEKPARTAKMKITDLNQHLSCILCGGYFIDATTIIECLHSFCRACIVRYLETSRYCPVCDVQIHKSKPLQCIRADKTLQDIVYKVVPGLFENEMKKRRELYSSMPVEELMKSRDAEDRGEDLDERFIYTPDELFNICMQYRRDECPGDNAEGAAKKPDGDEAPRRRFLRCPAAMGIVNLKKFIRAKYEIPNRFDIDVQYEDYSLEDNYTLMDVAYIFEWKRAGPMPLFYRIMERPNKPPHPCNSEKHDLRQVQTQADIPPDPSSKEEPPVKVPAFATAAEPSVKVPHVRQKSEKSNQSSANKASPSHARKGRPPIPTVKIAIAEIAAAERLRLAETKRKSDRKSSKDESRSDRNSTGDRPSTEKKKSSQSKSDSAGTSDKSCKSDHKTQSTAAVNSKSNKSTEKTPTLKVPKLTIPLTPKILQEVALQAVEDKVDLDNDFYEGRLVIAEPDASPRDTDDDLNDSVKVFSDVGAKKSDEDLDACEVDSGRGSDISSRAELRSLSGDDDIGSPGSSSIRTPDLDKQNPFLIPSPSSVSLPSPSSVQDSVNTLYKGDLNNNNSNGSYVGVNGSVTQQSCPGNDVGVLDLSVCHRKRGYDRNPMARPKQVANPPVLDKYRQTTPCLPMPKHPSFKLLPAVLPHTSIYKKPEVFRGNFRCRGSTLTVINPDPNSCRPKIVIKNLDPRTDHGHNRHHHHHHHNHHHQRM